MTIFELLFLLMFLGAVAVISRTVAPLVGLSPWLIAPAAAVMLFLTGRALFRWLLRLDRPRCVNNCCGGDEFELADLREDRSLVLVCRCGQRYVKRSKERLAVLHSDGREAPFKRRLGFGRWVDDLTP